MFSRRSNAAMHESIRKCHPKPREKVPECEICVETDTRPLSTPMKSLCDIGKELITSDIDNKFLECFCKGFELHPQEPAFYTFE